VGNPVSAPPKRSDTVAKECWQCPAFLNNDKACPMPDEKWPEELSPEEIEEIVEGYESCPLFNEYLNRLEGV